MLDNCVKTAFMASWLPKSSLSLHRGEEQMNYNEQGIQAFQEKRYEDVLNYLQKQ